MLVACTVAKEGSASHIDCLCPTFPVHREQKSSVILQVLLAGDLPDHPDLAGLPDDRAQRHRDRGRLRAGAGRAAGGRQAEGAAAGGTDAAARLHVHAAARPPRVAPPLRRQPLRRRAQVRGMSLGICAY